MTALARRQDIDVQYECRHVYYGDVRVGTIAKRIGIPPGEDPWGSACGFYPGCHPREQAHGTAATFDQARAEFDEAWRVFLSHRTEADFQEWRTHRAFTTACKYRMWDTGCRRSPRIAGQRAFAAPPCRSAACPITSARHMSKWPDRIRR
jgi:hypothetical protein